MSSKDNGKVSSANTKHNIQVDRDKSSRKTSKKNEDKDKPKFDGDKVTTKDDRTSGKSSTKIGSENKLDVNTENIKSKKHNIEGVYDDEAEERRSRRKEREREKELLQKSEKERENHKGDIDRDKEKKKRIKSNYEESSNRQRKDNVEMKDKSRDDKDDKKSRHRRDKEGDLNSKNKVDKYESNNKYIDDKESSKNQHRKDREDDSKVRSKPDKGELNYKHKDVSENVKHRNRSNNEEESKSRHRPDKDDSSSRYKTDKDESKSRHRSDRYKEDDNRKNSSHKSRTATDGKGDQNLITNGKTTVDKIEYQNSIKCSDVRNDKRLDLMEYEEDFEDYNDEDFEDENSSSSSFVEDNDSIEASSHSTSTKEITKPVLSYEKVESRTETSKNKDGIHTSFINFRLAQKKCSNDIVANKMLARAYDLSRLIDLDRSHFDIVDVAPVLEHSKYMLMFGRAGSQHIASQTGDDNMGRESQTEVIDERTVWCQHPPMDDDGCVRVMLDTSRANMGSLLTSDANKTALELFNESCESSAPLVEILELMDRVLEEDASPEVTTKIASTTKGQQVMSLGYNKYSCDGLPCILASFPTGNSGVFATVHQRSVDSGDGRAGVTKTFVCVWRVSNNCREPQRLLSCPSHSEARSSITALAFSPDSCPSHIFAGLDSGLIGLWDLREHACPGLVEGEPPGYFTGLHSDSSSQGHQSPIMAIHTSSTKTSASSYQLLSLDSSGHLCVWIVSSLGQGGQWAVASGSLADLNLRPGSRARMSVIATVDLLCVHSQSVTTMAVDLGNPSHIFIGNHNGHILHHDRSSQKPHQARTTSQGKLYGASASFDSGSITSLDFYPFFEPYLLAGYNDGCVKIFLVGRSEALVSFASKHRAAILVCKWSKSHPAIFLSLDGEGNFSIWNVLEDMYKPIHCKRLPGYVGFDLSCDSRWQSGETSSVHNKTRLLIWALDGSIEVHEMHPMFVEPELDDCFKTCALLQSLL